MVSAGMARCLEAKRKARVRKARCQGRNSACASRTMSFFVPPTLLVETTQITSYTAKPIQRMLLVMRMARMEATSSALSSSFRPAQVLSGCRQLSKRRAQSFDKFTEPLFARLQQIDGRTAGTCRSDHRCDASNLCVEMSEHEHAIRFKGGVGRHRILPARGPCAKANASKRYKLPKELA
jgi:hypothetical protein